MPKAVFPGQIRCPDSSRGRACCGLSEKCSILGIDSETRPSFTKGQSHKVAFYCRFRRKSIVSLFRLNLTGLTLPVITLLETPAVTKVGLSLRDDFMMLHKRAPFEQARLHRVAGICPHVRHSGQKPSKDICHPFRRKDFKEPARLSNWEADVLTPSQQQYAATDAWACLNIHNRLQELKRTGDFELAIEESCHTTTL